MPRKKRVLLERRKRQSRKSQSAAAKSNTPVLPISPAPVTTIGDLQGLQLQFTMDGGPSDYKTAYRWCFVPLCTNTTKSTPSKFFIHVPKDIERRKLWVQAARRGDPLVLGQQLFCCQDHFNMDEDMDNYLRFKMMGGNLMSKKHAVPHIFDCQPNRSVRPTLAPKRYVARRDALKLVQDAMIWEATLPIPNVDKSCVEPVVDSTADAEISPSAVDVQPVGDDEVECPSFEFVDVLGLLPFCEYDPQLSTVPDADLQQAYRSSIDLFSPKVDKEMGGIHQDTFCARVGDVNSLLFSSAIKQEADSVNVAATNLLDINNDVNNVLSTIDINSDLADSIKQEVDALNIDLFSAAIKNEIF